MTNKYLQDLSTQYKNKVVIVTGSTQGSGAEVAKLFAHRGAEAITICGRNEQQGLEIKSEIESIGSKCIFVKADLNEAEECQNIVKKTDTAFGKINSLINVAGFTERGTILSTTLDNYNRNFNIRHDYFPCIPFLLSDNIYDNEKMKNIFYIRSKM